MQNTLCWHYIIISVECRVSLCSKNKPENLITFVNLANNLSSSTVLTMQQPTIKSTKIFNQSRKLNPISTYLDTNNFAYILYLTSALTTQSFCAEKINHKNSEKLASECSQLPPIPWLHSRCSKAEWTPIGWDTKAARGSIFRPTNILN